MFLLDHVSITVRDLERARPFYDAVMAALGAVERHDLPRRLGYGERNGGGDDSHTYLSVRAGMAGEADRKHWCFRAASRAQVRAFHAAGLAHGGRDDGAPGLRPEYHADYYAAFLLDPDGNRIEAVTHRRE